VFDQFKDKYLQPVEAAMQEVVNSVDDLPAPMKTMLEYPFGWANADGSAYLHPTGKRTRPLLLMLTVEAAGGNWKDGVYAAAAVEILHNFSLVHDDIQDESETRHGRDTVWQVWGVPQAINTGDAMFALSYSALEHLSQTNIEPTTLIEIWRVYNRTILELTRGQHLDMDFETRDNVTVDEYLSMIRGKTAALLSCCTQIGALVGCSDVEIAQRYAAFGKGVGIAFQIRDDILGIWGDAEKTGKSAATDIVHRKKSVPILYGLAHSEVLRAIYAQPEIDAHDVQQAISVLEEVGAKDYALEQEKHFFDLSIAALEEAQPTGHGKETLMALVNRLFKRSY
jgi:geranylgeranyl diphosphate synthase type I